VCHLEAAFAALLLALTHSLPLSLSLSLSLSMYIYIYIYTDRTQSNGVLRMTDFEEMLLRHPTERGLAIDHWCALVVDDSNNPKAGGCSWRDSDFRVLSLPDKPGSGTDGCPTVWVKEVHGGRVLTSAVPATGKLSELLRTAEDIQEDDACDQVRSRNPPP
jgi:dipeptidase E